MNRVLLTALLVLVLNLPFGWWRASVRRLSPSWFVAIHLPVVLAIGLRLVMGIPFSLSILPVFVGAFVAGQFLGGRLKRRRAG